MVFAVTRIRERGSWLIARNHTLAAFRTRKNRQMSRTTQCIVLALAVALVWLPLVRCKPLRAHHARQAQHRLHYGRRPRAPSDQLLRRPIDQDA